MVESFGRAGDVRATKVYVFTLVWFNSILLVVEMIEYVMFTTPLNEAFVFNLYESLSRKLT